MTASNQEVVEKSQIVWLTVKPHTVSRILTEVSPFIRTDYHIIVSAAAGIPIKTLEKVIRIKEEVIRIELRRR